MRKAALKAELAKIDLSELKISHRLLELGYV